MILVMCCCYENQGKYIVCIAVHHIRLILHMIKSEILRAIASKVTFYYIIMQQFK